MILVRSPLRITFGGGGTDLSPYRHEHGGFCVSAAIDKYVYVAVTNPFTPGIYLKYARIQECHDTRDIENPHIRHALETTRVNRVSLTTFADIPAGTGLGSSGAISCALLKALYTYQRMSLPTADIANLAVALDRHASAEKGMQDPYASAYGGITAFTFEGDTVAANPLPLSTDTLHDLEDHLMLFFTGYVRDSGEVQALPSSQVTDNLHLVKALGYESREALEWGNTLQFASLLNQQWDLKESRKASPVEIAEWRRRGMEAGAIGCKLVGAGGGGFLLFYTLDPAKLRKSLPLVEVRFRFDFEGTRVMT